MGRRGLRSTIEQIWYHTPCKLLGTCNSNSLVPSFTQSSQWQGWRLDCTALHSVDTKGERVAGTAVASVCSGDTKVESSCGPPTHAWNTALHAVAIHSTYTRTHREGKTLPLNHRKHGSGFAKPKIGCGSASFQSAANLTSVPACMHASP